MYVLEVNPRASRTVPYVSKATGVALPENRRGRDARQENLRFHGRAPACSTVPQYFVKSPVFPFNKFPGVDPTLGPEMRSTGEVMGVGENFGEAFAKAQLSAGTPLPDKGRVFISVNDRDKAGRRRRWPSASTSWDSKSPPRAAPPMRFAPRACPSKTVFKVNEGRPNAVDLAEGRLARSDHLHRHQRRARLQRREGDPQTRRDLPRPLHHHHERRARRRSKRSSRAGAIPSACGACRKSTERRATAKTS